MIKKEIITNLQSIFKDYTPEKAPHIADSIEKLWMQSDDKKATNLVKAELQKEIKIEGVSLDVLKSMAKTISTQVKGNETDILPLASELWKNHHREGRIITAHLLGEIVLQFPIPVFDLSRKLSASIVSWEEADNMIMSIEPAVRKTPDTYLPWLNEWFTDPCKWIRRIAITIAGRLSFKKSELTEICLKKILINIEDDDLDVRRATSFAIRLCTRGDLKKVIEFVKNNAFGTAYGKVWVFSDVIRSMAKKFLPEFKHLLPLYEKWRDKHTDSKSIKSLEAAIKLLQSL